MQTILAPVATILRACFTHARGIVDGLGLGGLLAYRNLCCVAVYVRVRVRVTCMCVRVFFAGPCFQHLFTSANVSVSRLAQTRVSHSLHVVACFPCVQNAASSASSSRRLRRARTYL